MRVLITGGGTAGHVNPALAIADAIISNEPESVIEYVGTEKGLEGRLVEKRGMKLHAIEVMGLRRSLSLANFKALYCAMTARSECKRIIREFAPDVVIGTGGYVSWPLISAAAAMGIPTVLHESNAEPGFAIKTLKNKADLILVNFESTAKWLEGAKNRVLRVGMPVKKEFYKEKRSGAEREKHGTKQERGFHILSFGGSLGARTMNLAILELMKTYLKDRPWITIKHSCGAREFETIGRLFREAGLDAYPNLILTDYIYDMPAEMWSADLVISRSGASTLAELAAAEKASILIPSPNVTGDQQRKNAALLAAQDAAIVIEDSEAVETLSRAVKDLCEEKGRSHIRRLETNVKRFSVINCEDEIYRAVRYLVDESQK